MNKLKILIGCCLLVCITFSTSAQKTEMIVGKWKYEDLAGKEKLDSMAIKMLGLLFGDMQFYFNDAGLYRAELMRIQEEGTWEFNEEKQMIITTSNNGEESYLEVIELTKDKMTIHLDKGKDNIILARTTPTAEDEIKEKIIEIETTAATIDQVSKQWFLVRREHAKGTEKSSELAEEFLKGAYISFTKEGSFETQILGLKEEGKWEFGKGNTSLITTADGHSKTWNIHQVSENELILVKGKSEAKWVFSTEAP